MAVFINIFSKKTAVALEIWEFWTIFTKIKLFINQNLKIMNKAELIDAIAKDANLTKADAGKALDAFVKNVTGALKNDDRVALVGFGSWSVSERAERTGRNPQTGKTITIPAKKVVKFRPGAELK